ncbi:Uncharacterized protein OS=Gordonia hirsuta DSM 44140 = NBRC 16056 GN=GOHSU_12_00950 PE=4 SV=1 [Gemmata massiliana]|uniref:Uncharacterized protein n=1 Tax=Gemmata massiliana TaxID=1210884 RepID=A0A6P2DC34_9BACT|nr:hypothetical protein [Gemmata massiliana]VTR98820.1 Uncharacterized protein OS=Gordonia hirsuta DSM 44140 = NBRC 16056 GN=GOHSU_12_00950 PE=4 SV=1 [Gemmata massiliana]
MPTSASPLTHLARAFAWHLGRVVPSQPESERLAAAGLTEPVAQRYAVWRRSLLLVAATVSAVAFALAVVDLATGGMGEYTVFGKGLEVAWLVAAGALPLAALVGAMRWTRPGAGALLLIAAWAATFLLPFVYALLPVGLIYHVQPVTPESVAKLAAKPSSPATVPPSKNTDDDDDDDEKPDSKPAPVDPAVTEKAVAMEETLVEFVLSGGGYLLLLPAVLALIPGAVNGCLRVKTLVPAAQLPGWLLVTVAPAFLLFWLVLLAVANHAARSPLLVLGVLLWAGSPTLYSVFGRVFVRPHLTDADAARIGRVKRIVGITGLTGIALLVAFALTSKVAGLRVVGFDREAAVSTKLDALADDDEIGLEDVQTAMAESKSVIYAFDLASFRLVIDFLAKLLVVTAVFADLALRATLVAWRNDRSLRGSGDTAYDTSASTLAAALGNES